MSVDAPGLKDAIYIPIVAGTAYVIDDFIAPIFDQRIPNPCCERIEHFVPGCALPLPFAALAHASERAKDAFGIVDLVDGRWTLGAVGRARAGKQWSDVHLL